LIGLAQGKMHETLLIYAQPSMFDLAAESDDCRAVEKPGILARVDQLSIFSRRDQDLRLRPQRRLPNERVLL
jgi:hypothetical protein